MVWPFQYIKAQIECNDPEIITENQNIIKNNTLLVLIDSFLPIDM